MMDNDGRNVPEMSESEYYAEFQALYEEKFRIDKEIYKLTSRAARDIGKRINVTVMKRLAKLKSEDGIERELSKYKTLLQVAEQLGEEVPDVHD
jgi:hypothetical protein